MSHHFFNIYFNYYYNKFEYVVFYFNTLNYNIEDIFNLKSKEIPYFSFYYYHDVTNELKTIKVDENYTHLIDDGIINKISGCFGIKLEQFSKELREEIQLYVKIKQIHYDKDALMQIYSRLEQIKQIKFLYTKMKDLLNDSFTCNLNVLNFEKLKLNNINQVIFRQSLFGGIEFDDVFKNNIILRMLDLSQVKLDYINIHGMDFSGTNIHINPQVIYRKDMSFVNASGLKFSPWDDSFEGVNLRGTIITDYEANIHKENVKSIKLFQPLVNIGKNITVNKDYYYHYKKDINQIIKIYEILGKLVDIFNNGFFNKRIVLKQINQIIFKNHGLPNSHGYIEFEDFFKNNDVLRMIDLSQVKLDRVDIRYMNINPQVIYQKDMTGVNAFGLKFSPWDDSFEGVNLRGAIITDYEANIDLSKVKYDDFTQIVHNVIDVFDDRPKIIN